MQHSERNRYTVNDLLANDGFQRWALNEAGSEEKAFWESWISQSAENRRRAEEAARIITLLRFKPQKAEANVAAQLNRLRTRIRESGGRQAIGWKFPSTRVHRIAAVLVCAVLLGAIVWGVKVYFQRSNLIAIATDYGERHRISLPDGSTVILNGHSELRFAKNWQKRDTREVTLKGEAFFSVVRSQNPRPQTFIVHTEDGMVTVLGTEFTVTNWQDFTRVVLQRGKVEVTVLGEARRPGAGVVLSPNELVQFRRDTDSLTVERVNPEVYTSWTTDMLVFDRTPIAYVIERLEQTYGIEVRAGDAGILHEKISGKIENDKRVLLKGLASLLKRQVREAGGTIYIE